MDIKSEIVSFIRSPRSETYDYCAILPGPHEIARIVSGLANHMGGHLVFGISDVQGYPEPVGISPEFRIEEMIDRALSLLSPNPVLGRYSLQIEGKRLVAIKVDRSTEHILLRGDYFVREGTNTLKKKLSQDPEEIKKIIREFVSKSEINNALTLLEDFLPHQRNKVIELKAQLIRSKEENVMGHLPSDGHGLTLNRITKAILLILDKE